VIFDHVKELSSDVFCWNSLSTAIPIIGAASNDDIATTTRRRRGRRKNMMMMVVILKTRRRMSKQGRQEARVHEGWAGCSHLERGKLKL
jgi:hypothetical protein